MGREHLSEWRSARDADFQGTRRFFVRRRLGEGAVGVVYLAHDRERNQEIALKTLRRTDALALYRFKQEFRALADVAHPNLAALYELVSKGHEWFFTMELVDGVDFLSYVRPGVSLPPGTEIVRDTEIDRGLLTTDRGDELWRAGPRSQKPHPHLIHPISENRLRRAALQLARGLYALHDAGKLHRDIKPTNVLVTRDDRVVVLDFGLVTELHPTVLEPSASPRKFICGTAGYMSPEQAAAQSLTSASDWYSVGVMLYEAITGRLPFFGTVEQVLFEKQKGEPPAPSVWVPEVPRDLDRLCVDLLRTRADQRPSGREILERLGEKPIDIELSGDMPAAKAPTSSAVPFVGREAQLKVLADALDAVTRGRTVVAAIGGLSGVGKTALARHFVDQLSAQQRAVVLSGRCYERESVPFKGLDSLIDALAGYLTELRPGEVEELLPRDSSALARLFPVLLRVHAIARGASKENLLVRDPQEIRRRGFGALRALVSRLAEKRPLVLLVDDIQWSDGDSAALLGDILRPPHAPPILVIATYAGPEPSSLIKLRAASDENQGTTQYCEVAVGALTEEEARDLAFELLTWPERVVDLPPDVALFNRQQSITIAREAGGNPFFVAELVRYIQIGSEDDTRSKTVTLEEVVEARIARLEPEARELLEIICVAGRPIEITLAIRAAHLDEEGLASVPMLRGQHLARTRGSGGHDLIEPFHDRVRQIAQAKLPATVLAGHHRRLARAMEATDTRDFQALATHYEGAGENIRASQLFARAAELASETLAFDLAAQLFRQSLQLCPTNDHLREREACLADALANAGRGADAGRAYLLAAESVPAPVALERKRLAAEQFLRSGHVDEGIKTLNEVLTAVGLRLAETPKRALASLLLQRARLKVRGLGFVARPDVPQDSRARIDVCWSVACGLGMVDVIRSSEFQTRHLLLALEAGDPYRITRALATEALGLATRGSEGREATQRMLERGESLALEIGHPHAVGLTTMARGMAANLEGHWRRGRELLEIALGIFEDRCTGVAWETSTASHMTLWALAYLGEIAELGERVPALLHEAKSRGDLYAATLLTTGLPNLAWLQVDDVEGARRVLSEGMGQWSECGFHLQHYNQLLAEAQIDLYLGDGETALRRLELRWPLLQGSLLLRVQQIRVEAWHLRARAEIAAAQKTSGEPRLRHLERAERDARQIAKEGVAWGGPLAAMVRAGSLALRGEDREAARLFCEAALNFEAADMNLYAAIARRREGELRGGDTGARLVETANRWLRRQKIRSPNRFAAMLGPGTRG